MPFCPRKVIKFFYKTLINLAASFNQHVFIPAVKFLRIVLSFLHGLYCASLTLLIRSYSYSYTVGRLVIWCITERDNRSLRQMAQPQSYPVTLSTIPQSTNNVCNMFNISSRSYVKVIVVINIGEKHVGMRSVSPLPPMASHQNHFSDNIFFVSAELLLRHHHVEANWIVCRGCWVGTEVKLGLGCESKVLMFKCGLK